MMKKIITISVFVALAIVFGYIVFILIDNYSLVKTYLDKETHKINIRTQASVDSILKIVDQKDSVILEQVNKLNLQTKRIDSVNNLLNVSYEKVDALQKLTNQQAREIINYQNVIKMQNEMVEKLKK
jgi:cell division protein YceG involved in septum cleavage